LAYFEDLEFGTSCEKMAHWFSNHLSPTTTVPIVGKYAHKRLAKIILKKKSLKKAVKVFDFPPSRYYFSSSLCIKLLKIEDFRCILPMDLGIFKFRRKTEKEKI